MKDTIFIKFPWTKCPANEIYITSEQIKSVYEIILKAFDYNYRYEQGTEYGLENIEKYNLNNIKVYNSFVNETLAEIFDPIARDYVLTTLEYIRHNSFSNTTVKDSYMAFYSMFKPTSSKRNVLGTILSNEPEKFIDFCSIFKNCERTTLSTTSGPLKEILDFYKFKIDEHSKLMEKLSKERSS